MGLLRENDWLFGRTHGFEYLFDRVQKNGLTFVSGGPRMGKSCLIKALCDKLIDEGWLVGYIESIENKSDLLRLVLTELYTCWLQEASYKQQVKSMIR